MTVRFVLLTPEELGPYVEGLRAIERATEYPIGDGSDAFTIDHGEAYHPFFTALGQDARFLLALDGERVVGGVAGMYRDVRIRGRTVRGGLRGRLEAGARVPRRRRCAADAHVGCVAHLHGSVAAGMALRLGRRDAGRARGRHARRVKGLHIGKLAAAPPERSRCTSSHPDAPRRRCRSTIARLRPEPRTASI